MSKKINSMIILCFFALCGACFCACDEKKLEDQIILVLDETWKNPIPNNVDHLCELLDKWGYPNYFELKNDDDTEIGAKIILTLYNAANSGNLKALNSLINSSIIINRDNNIEFQEWLGELVGHLAESRLQDIFDCLTTKSTPTQTTILRMIKYPVNDTIKQELIQKCYSRLKEDKKYQAIYLLYESL